MRQDFKQTEVGVIPEDWELHELPKLYSIERNAAYSRADTVNNGPVKYLHYGDIHTGLSGLIQPNEIPEEISKDNGKGYYLLSSGDVVLADASEDIDGVGAAVEIFNPNNEACIAGLHTIVLSPRSNQVALGFGALFAKMPIVGSQFRFYAAGLKVFGLSKSNIKKVTLPLPPLQQQRAIAEVLSDVDAEIGEAKKLLAKKIRLKTGLERQLLTDDGSWVKCRFSDLLSFEQPQEYLVEATQISETGEIPVLTPGKTFILGYCSSGVVGVDNQDSIECIVFDDFTTASKFVDFSFRLRSSAVKVLRAKDDVTHTRALEALLRKVRYKPEDHKRHWISQFQHFEVSVPDSLRLSEISLTIRDIDNEISSLEALIRRSQAKKEGLMQTLLTGKIRLT